MLRDKLTMHLSNMCSTHGVGTTRSDEHETMTHSIYTSLFSQRCV